MKFAIIVTILCSMTLLSMAAVMSEADKKIIVDEHNNFRNQIALQTYKTTPKLLPFASNMIQMYWNDEIAQTAEKIANLCKYEHSLITARKLAKFFVGENIRVTKSLKADWKTVITAWFNEISYYRNKSIDSFKAGDVKAENFSQLVWANSYWVGCSFRTCKNYGLYVCNYGPTGNVMGQPLFKHGPKVECKCPKDTACQNVKYKGLCCPAGHCKDTALTYLGEPIEGTIPKIK